MEKIIIVSEEDRDTVQRADIEMSARRDIIAFMINSGVDITNERFIQYQKEYDVKYYAFEQAKTNLQQKYLSDVGVATRWNLNYATCELSYDV